MIESREFQKVKQRLLGLTNFGKPWIYVIDGNYRNRGELLLRHEYNGVELKVDEARDTLANLQYVWPRPCISKPFRRAPPRSSASTGPSTRCKGSEGPMTLTESLLPS